MGTAARNFVQKLVGLQQKFVLQQSNKFLQKFVAEICSKDIEIFIAAEICCRNQTKHTSKIKHVILIAKSTKNSTKQ